MVEFSKQHPGTYPKWILGIHLVFWVLMAVLMLLIFNFIFGRFLHAMVATLVNLAGFVVLVYIHLLWLLPRFFDQKKYLSYLFALLVILLLTSAFRFWVGWGLIDLLSWDYKKAFTPTYFGSMVISGSFILLITIPLRLIENWIKKKALEQELKTYQLEAELRFLKAQVNPHFLFNALNNIYALSFTGSKKAPEMILKLSEMMSYMLYDCKNEEVALTEEVNYLRNYIALQQLKKDGELKVEFQIEGQLEGCYITPMLFIPFFENAFKHGNLEDLQEGWLKSTLRVEEEVLHFRISNSLPSSLSNYPKGGVGLDNIRERLRLVFPDRHELTIKPSVEEYSVDLKLKLSEP